MSRKSRDIVTIAVILLMSMVAFGAGFIVNEFVDPQPGGLLGGGETDDFAVFWEALDRVEQSFIGELPTAKETTYGAVRGALSELDDPYTIFIEPVARDQEQDRLRGNFGGVGATLQRNEAGDVILTPMPEGPAEDAGILAGDILVAVDGEEVTAEMTVQEIASSVRGEEGTTVTLTVLHPGTTEPIDIEIIRAVILLPSVTYRLLEDDRTIGYIQLSRFSAESGAEVREALVDLKNEGAEQLILDLRHNPGGLLDAAVEVSDHFLIGGPIFSQISKGEDEKLFEANEEAIAGTMPLAVLVNGATASAAEIVAGALQDRNRATLFGTPTFGKGSVQLVYDLSDGSSVHVTSARWYTPNRHQIDQQGLQPDILVEQDGAVDGNIGDSVLEQAVAYLRSDQ